MPAPFAGDAIWRPLMHSFPLVVCITEGIPVLDMMQVKRALVGSSTRIIGSNCSRIITTGECKNGIMPGYIHNRPRGGGVSFWDPYLRSGLLKLQRWGLGQSTCIGIVGIHYMGYSFLIVLSSSIKTQKHLDCAHWRNWRHSRREGGGFS